MLTKIPRKVLFDLGVVLLGVFVFSALLSSFDAFEWLHEYSRSHEEYELDEIIVAVLVSPIFILWFAIRRWRDALAESNARFLTEREHELTKSLVGHDLLTGLPNRFIFSDRLLQAMTQAKRKGNFITIAYIDLDNFKEINDKYGHDIGDKFLIEIANHLQTALRESDSIARLGGDEFVVLFSDIAETSGIDPLVKRLLEAATTIINLDRDITLETSASIGLTCYPQDEEVDPDQLLRQADQAMYESKVAGKNRYHFFDADKDQNIRTQHESLTQIKEAIFQKQFVLYYQPKVNMQTGEVIGVEALIRWLHPEKGLLTPIHFLPVIENHLLSVELGNWVINESLSQMSHWLDLKVKLPVSINIEAIHLQQADFVDQLREHLKKFTNIQPDMLTLEVVETSALEDMSHVSQTLNECRTIGVRCSIDDFGTGFSSLTYLKRLPANELKMDQSFIRDILEDLDDLTIVEGVSELARIFKMDFVAEGIENKEIGARLLDLDCFLGQGYAIARPMPAEDIPEWIKNWQKNPLW